MGAVSRATWWPPARVFGAVAVLMVVLAAGATGSARPVSAAEPDFGSATLDASFTTGVRVTQPVTLDGPLSRVELLLTEGSAIGPRVIVVPAPAGSDGPVTLEYTVEPGTEGHILPNTPIRASWRLIPADGGPPVVSPEVEGIYRDDRFAWQTLTGSVVRVHWYEGPQEFGARAVEIGDKAVEDASELLGVTEDEPIDFFIYADQDAFYDALGPATRENVGGQASSEIRTMFALIGPGEINDPWVSTVVPHELVHLVFDTAVSNPYHYPLRWLNEGLAVYLSQGYDAGDRAAVERAADGGTLLPLAGLGGQFPTSADRFFLAYAESVSAVDFLIRTHGQDALVDLIGSYADGRTDDEVFSEAIGMDVGAFDAAWLDDLGADEPVLLGPQPAPIGPVPADWGAGAPILPGAPVASAPVHSAAPVLAPAAPGAPDDDDLRIGGLLVLALGVAAGAVALVVTRSRRRGVGA
jgi:hypothetical protein